LAQFHDLIDQMDNHVKMLQQKKTDRAAELEESSAKLGQTNEKIERLKESIKLQELSVEEARTLQNTLKGVREAIDRVQGLNETRRNRLFQHTSDQQTLWNAVEEIVPVYNAALRELVPLLPEAAVDLSKLSASNRVVSSENLDLGNGLEQEIQARLGSIRDLLVASLAQARHDYQERLDELGQSEGMLTEAVQNVKIIEDKIMAREATLEQEREASHAKCAVRLREAEVVETKVASLRDPVALEERMAQYERQCAELESMRMRNRETNCVMMKAVLTELENATAAMDQFDDFLSSKISECQKYRSELRASYGTVEVQPRQVTP
jgi:peptidoglycan hydrolase CwlO-like protein